MKKPGKSEKVEIILFFIRQGDFLYFNWLGIRA